MTPAIRVQNLGKKYTISHQGQNEATSLRELLTGGFQRLRRRTPSTAGLGNTVIPPACAESEDFWALQNISFDVQPGERIGIIGRNGAGKSTLLKILSRITDPTTGCVRIRGRMASLLEVGTGFHPELTGRENVFLNGAILGMDNREIRNKFDEIVAFSEIEKFLDTPVKRYSSGMYVRLAFAVAAHLESEILVVDEVLAVGDVDFQKKCLGKIGEITNDGRTVLFVSHNMTAIHHICSRALLLSSGRIVEDGDPRRVIDAYLADGGGFDSSSIDLSSHPNRAKGAEPFLTKIEIRVGDQPSNSLKMGQGMEVRVQYRSSGPVKGLRIGITINDTLNQRIVSFSPTHQNPSALDNAAAQGEVSCVIHSLNIVPGTYSLSVIAGNSTRDIDRIEECCRIHILPDDVYKTGRIPTKEHGLIYLPADWRLQC